MGRWDWSQLALVVVLLSVSGCSWILVNPPPSPPVPHDVQCTTSRAPQILDLVFAGLTAADAVAYAGVRYSTEKNLTRDTTVVLGASLVAIAMHLMSNVYGSDNTEACREAQRAMPPASSPVPGESTPAKGVELPSEAAPPTRPGCGSDKDCKGERVCVDSKCVDPPVKSLTPSP